MISLLLRLHFIFRLICKKLYSKVKKNIFFLALYFSTEFQFR